jgi:hypothetical protein
MMILKPSDEQMKVINAIKDGYNVQVDAVAGSGKTTTVLSLAHYNPTKYIVQITYNSELKSEVRDKKCKYSELMDLDKLEIHTYHSFATTYYSKDAKTDIGLEDVLEEDNNPKIQLPSIKILVIDEIQDMNELYYRFILKILKDTNNPLNIQILTLGDKSQGLYEFKGADTRYLTLSSQIFNFSPHHPFKKLNLSTSYRITNEIATFINEGMLGYKRLYAIKDGPSVMYMRHPSPYQVYKMIGFKLLELLNSGLLKPDEIFILAPSVKCEAMSHVKLLENMLVSNGIPCYVPLSETSTVNSETIKNKVIFTSFHQSKGRERKLVVVFGFDDNYFKFFEREKDPEICPSTLYVATTRATDTLILVECSKPLPFLHYDHNIMQTEDHIIFEGMSINLNIEDHQTPQSARPSTPKNIHNTSPTNLIKFLDENVLIQIMKIITREGLFSQNPVSQKGTIVEIPSSIKKQDYYGYQLTEEVSELNGLVIPSIFEERKSNRVSKIRQKVANRLTTLRPNHIYSRLLQNVDMSQEHLHISDYLKVANVYNSIKEAIHFKVAQICKYDWLNEIHCDTLLDNISLHISDEEATTLTYEESIIEQNYGNENEGKTSSVYEKIDKFTKSTGLKSKIRFTAIIDAMNEHTIYEFKCAENLEPEPEHLLQVIIYAWLWHNACETIDGPRLFKLLNIRTGMMHQLNYKESSVNKIMELLFVAKFAKRETRTDDEFIKRCQNLSAQILQM